MVTTKPPHGGFFVFRKCPNPNAMKEISMTPNYGVPMEDPKLQATTEPPQRYARLTYKTFKRNDESVLQVVIGPHTFEYVGESAHEFLDTCGEMENAFSWLDEPLKVVEDSNA